MDADSHAKYPSLCSISTKILMSEETLVPQYFLCLLFNDAEIC
jgi:hypothetical protein